MVKYEAAEGVASLTTNWHFPNLLATGHCRLLCHVCSLFKRPDTLRYVICSEEEISELPRYPVGELNKKEHEGTKDNYKEKRAK